MIKSRLRLLRTVMIVLSICLVSDRAFAADDYVWWEGEKPAKTNFPAKSWFSASTFPKTRGQLSGGAWLSSSSKCSGAEQVNCVDFPLDRRLAAVEIPQGVLPLQGLEARADYEMIQNDSRTGITQDAGQHRYRNFCPQTHLNPLLGTQTSHTGGQNIPLSTPK